MSINQVAITGNLGADAELRYTKSGLAVMRCSVAVTERIQQDGEWVDKPNWIELMMFGKRAERLAPCLHRGNKIAVSGHLHQAVWEQDGAKHSKLELRVDDIELMTVARAQGSK